MPSVETRPTTKGTSYIVRFRLGGKQTSKTFTVKRAAQAFAAEVDRYGAVAAVRKLELGIAPSDPFDLRLLDLERRLVAVEQSLAETRVELAHAQR